MTPKEFKAWFDGFTEAVAGNPTDAQWARIKQRVAEIDGSPVTERVFVDRYLPTVPYWARPSGPYWSVAHYATCQAVAAGNDYDHRTAAYKAAAVDFSGPSAMLALGRADAQSLASA